MKKRIVALVLAAVTLITLASCGKRGTIAMEYEDVYITEEMYGYWLAHYKAIFMENYTGVTDTDTFWDSVISENMTAEEYFTAVAEENIKKTVATAWLFDYMGLSFTNTMKKEVKSGIEDLSEMLFDGNDAEFDAYLSTFGVDRDDLYEIYVMDAKVEYVYNYLYGSSGVMNIPDSDKLVYTKDNYSHIVHIYVNNNFRYVTVESELGTLTHDPETGEAYTEELTEAEKAEKNATIAAIDAALADGDDFIDVWEEYSEDKLYKDGYYLKEGSTFIAEVVDAAFEMEIGEVVRLETKYGVHYIKRFGIEGTPWSNEANKDFFGSFDGDIADYVFNVMLTETASKVNVNTDITKKFALRDIEPNYYI